MPKKKSPALTEAELRLMEILWEKGSATASKVVEALPKRLSLAYSTVLSTLRILEEKGYVRHTREGRSFIYHPVADRSDALREAVRHLVSRFFNSSPELLVLNILEREKIDLEELKRLKKMIEKS